MLQLTPPLSTSLTLITLYLSVLAGEGYTCDQYPRTVRLKPYSIAHGYGWALLVVGGAHGEQIWCRTLFSDACRGWLASSSGLCAEQQWYLGYVGETHTPLQGCVRFVDATVPSLNAAVDQVAPASSGAPLQDMITQLGQQIDELHRNFSAKSEGEKKQMDDQLQSMLHAVEMRSQTTEKGMQAFATQVEQMETLTTERCESFEKHFMESLARESSSIAKMQQEHLDCTNSRLLDIEKRALDRTEHNAHELRTMVAEGAVKVERAGADMQNSVERRHEDSMAELRESLGKAIDAIEQNMPTYIIQTLRRYLQQRGLRLEAGDVLQLTGPSCARAWEIEDGEELPADGQNYGRPLPEGAKDSEKVKSDDDAETVRQPLRHRQSASPARRRSRPDRDENRSVVRSRRGERRGRSRFREDSRGRRQVQESRRSRSRCGSAFRRDRSRSYHRRNRQHKPCTCPPAPRPRGRSPHRRDNHRAPWRGGRC